MRCMAELQRSGENYEFDSAFLESFDLESRVLEELSQFASGYFGEGPVDMERWFAGLDFLASSLASKFNSTYEREPSSLMVVRNSLEVAYQVFLIAMHRYVAAGGERVFVRTRATGRDAVVLFSFLNAGPEVEAFARSFECFQVRRLGQILALRLVTPLVAEVLIPVASKRRARILLIESEDEFGRLSERVLSEAGYKVTALEPADERISELLQSSWNLVLCEDENGQSQIATRDLVEASGHPIGYLGGRGLSAPFGPTDLIEYVQASLGAGVSETV